MGSKHHTGMIDGYSSVQAAARRAAAGKTPPRPAPVKPKPPPEPPSPDGPKRIGHTVMPTRHELVCFACGYAFPVTGQLEKIFCPKCKEQLECGDLVVDGHRTEDCRTVGTVTVSPGATVTDATLTATRIVVAGDVRRARLNPTRTLELETGAQVDLKALVPLDVTIRETAELSFDAVLRCRTLDVHGNLCARVETEGSLTLHPGCRFSGEIQTAHLVVLDGAALRGRLKVTAKPTEDRSTQKGT